MTDLQKGLDEQQAAERLAEYGENRIDPPKGRSALGIFFSQFCDILIVILAAAAVFSVTVGEFTEAVSILAIMLLNAVMGFVQEYRTERTLARLAELSAPHSLVRRGGRTVELPSSAVVPGDILLLAPGDSVAADGVLRAVSALETDESMLTGEAHPVAKKAGGRVFMGTTVCAGRGEAEVEKTGMRTEMGGIAGMIGTVKEEKTPLEQQLTVFGNQIAVGCLSICALDPGRLGYAAELGVKLVNLTWNRANVLSGSNLEERKRGLSEQGKDFVRRAQELEILMDVSHLSDPGFWDLIDLTQRPVVASHSDSRALCDHSRNLTDEMFCAIRDTGGFVGLNFYTPFIGRSNSIDDIFAHLEHFLELDGEKTVGFGGDWDGCDKMPDGINGIQDMVKIYEKMLQRNYKEELICDIFYNNLKRTIFK